MVLPDEYSPGLETVRYALPLIQEECKDITAKVSLSISVYGVKAMVRLIALPRYFYRSL